MRRSRLAALLATLAVPAHVVGETVDPGPGRVAVIVGKRSFVSDVSVDDLRELYLRRTRLWPNGERAIPINLPPGHPARERFSRRVLGRAPEDLVSYWDARYFEGIVPPLVLQSAAAIRAYLALERAAIAYVPEEEVDDTCRILLVFDGSSAAGVRR